MTNLELVKRVHCIGLGGVGVSAVAKIFQARGVEVSGSDARRSPLVDDAIQQGIIYFPDERGEYITNDIDLIVATDDAPPNHPQRLIAQALGIPVQNFSETLGILSANKTQRLCIAGTNGKSTTAALTGLLLADAGCDPTVFVGSRVPAFNGNLRLGQGSMFVIEADEYHDHFLHYRPTIITLTNIEPDHLDYFHTEQNMLSSYQKFISTLPSGGTLVVNADDKRVMNLAKETLPVLTYAIHHEADLRAVDIIQTAGSQSWTTMWQGKSLGRFTLPLPGEFNIMNALAAMASALSLGVDPSTFTETICQFTGIWRRFQVLNPASAITIVSDYAHHPMAVDQTLQGAKSFYPGRRVIAVFQPHHRSRLTTLFNDFTTSFQSADEVLIVETYSVTGRELADTPAKTSTELVTALQKKKIAATFVANPSNLEGQLQPRLQPGDVVIIMGAGDIWRQAEQLAKHYA